MSPTPRTDFAPIPKAPTGFSIAERKEYAAGLMQAARYVGIAVKADQFGRGEFQFTDIGCLHRLIEAAEAATAKDLTEMRRQIWNIAVESAALVVQPVPHVQEERTCNEVARAIRRLSQGGLPLPDSGHPINSAVLVSPPAPGETRLPADSGLIPIPANADQASGFVLCGMAWLQQHAPERLKVEAGHLPSTLAPQLKTDAMSIFNDPPSETPQAVRDVIEWYTASIDAALAAPTLPQRQPLTEAVPAESMAPMSAQELHDSYTNYRHVLKGCTAAQVWSYAIRWHEKHHGITTRSPKP